jgi:DNA-binding NarL/FixJ family response regulator
MTRTDSGRRADLVLAAVFAAMAAMAAIDLATDLGRGMTVFHAALEGAMVVLGVGAAARLVLQVRALTQEARDLREHASQLAAHLDASRADAARWRREASGFIDGLGAAIDAQLERWGLSPAEKAIALLLLKGLSHKEIAALRDVGETTVRQQARAIYRKAGLSGRSDLAAFFLEDLLSPSEPRPRVGPER